jgi:signal transduction histidine kinase
MKEIVRIDLDNEMDLILAHKRTMKLVELCGMSQIVQTSFATAVSEVSRCVIGSPEAKISLCIEELRANRKQLLATISSASPFDPANMAALRYAKKLAGSVNLHREKERTEIGITQVITFSGLLNDVRIKGFVDYFVRELPLSPYDELRKKNIQLIELAEKLRNRDSQYEKLTETLPLMIFSTTPGGEVVFVNKWMQDFFAQEDGAAQKAHWTRFVSLTDGTHVREEWEKHLQTGKKLTIHARFLPAGTSQQPLWHMVTLIPTFGEENVLSGWTGFAVDVNAQKTVEETLLSNTHLKEAQKQLLGYQQRLEEKISELNKSNHDLEQFAYIASHDLQEPLRKIRTFTELLEKNIDNPENRRKYIDKIDQASERMTTLIRDVLNYSRLSRAETVFEPVDLNALIGEIRVDMELLIEEKKARISVNGLIPVSGIRQQLHQLFYNLVSNALKFSKEDPVIEITGAQLPETAANGIDGLQRGKKYLEIKVKDNGIGFDRRYASQVFTIFKRLNSKDVYSGTGIGLALCKKIVDNHFGTISADSEPGVGSVFTVILPVD